MKPRFLALLAGSAIALTAVAPAHAAPWNGSNFNFGLGNWRFYNFKVDDVHLNSTSVSFTQPNSGGTDTDIWDGGIKMYVTSATAGLDDENDDYYCDNNSDINITEDAGSLAIECTTDWSNPTNDDVAIRGHIRIYGPDGDLIRYVLEITNNSASAITDFNVRTLTDFGTCGDIWGYQNVDEDILSLPAIASSGNAAAIETTDSNWLVNIDGLCGGVSVATDPSGSLAWGNSAGSVDVALTVTNGDRFTTDTDAFTVGAGKTVYLAYFTGWDPAHLNTLGYNPGRFDSDAETEANGDVVVANSAEFNSFSGRLAAGLPDGANVINWAPAPDEDLADTGAETSSLWVGVGLLIAGVAVVAVRRRSRA